MTTFFVFMFKIKDFTIVISELNVDRHGANGTLTEFNNLGCKIFKKKIKNRALQYCKSKF